jgi:tRNA(Ile)-lysidine synthase
MTIISMLERRVARALKAAGYSGNDTRLVVAVSGGPDSSALLYSLHRLGKDHGLHIHVAHLNHNFRQEADADALFVAGMARDLGLSATVEKRDPIEFQSKRRITSFEQAARELRYHFLGEVARSVGAATVVVGHTADDLAETVLQHIIRGSGLHGLRGMTELSPWPWPRESPGLRLFRPLLTCTKADTAFYCQELGKEFRDDPANYLPRFTRNRIRHHLLPLLAEEYNPRITDSLVRLARTAALELDFLEKQTDEAWAGVVEGDAGPNTDVIRLRRSALVSLHPALRRLLLRRGYTYLRGNARRLQESHLVNMEELATTGSSGRRVELPGGICLDSTHESLVLSKGIEVGQCPYPAWRGELFLTLPTSVGAETIIRGPGWQMTARLLERVHLDSNAFGDEHTALLDRNSLEGEVRLRTRLPGDRFQPLGMTQEKKLQDFFIDAHVPRHWRDAVPLLVCEQRIAWVVGYRIAEWAKARLEDPLSRVVQFTYQVNGSSNPGLGP